VGDTYFKKRNYRGAESRLREALEYKSHDPETTYKLAVSVDKLGKIDAARVRFTELGDWHFVQQVASKDGNLLFSGVMLALVFHTFSPIS
jgi:Flp pilus assembly protein TadD